MSFHPFRGAGHYNQQIFGVGQYIHQRKMPSVADELAALREKGSVKQHASNLSTAGGAALSTPEAEEAVITAIREKTNAGNKQATEILKKGGSGGMSQELEHSLVQNERRKMYQKKKQESVRYLNKGASGVTETTGKLPYLKENPAKPPVPVGEPKVQGNEPTSPYEDDNVPETEAKPQEEKKTEEAEAPKVEQQKPTAPTSQSSSAPKVTEPTLIEDNEDDDVPALEETGDVPDLEGTGVEAADASAEPEKRSVTNRNEKKARKMMQRLGMRPISGIERVTLKMGGGKGFFFIDQPDVFAASGSRTDTYVFFGEARQGANEAQQQQQMAMAQQQAAAAAGGVGLPKVKVQPPGMASTFEAAPEPIKKEEPAVDESGVDSKDVDLIMSQASCSRAKAVAALKDSDGDLVNAIMSLSM